MAPDFLPKLVVVDSELEDEKLKGNAYHYEAKDMDALVQSRWNADEKPDGYEAVAGGVVYVKEGTFLEKDTSLGVYAETDGELQFEWIEGLKIFKGSDDKTEWAMLVIILPAEHTLIKSTPPPTTAKEFTGRIAVQWRLKGDETFKVSARFKLSKTKKSPNSCARWIRKRLCKPVDNFPGPSNDSPMSAFLGLIRILLPRWLGYTILIAVLVVCFLLYVWSTLPDETKKSILDGLF